MKKNYKVAAVAFLCGSLFFSGISMAAQSDLISVSFDKLRFIVQGTDHSSTNGQFDNQGKLVPESIVYKGTTYVPLRLAGQLVGQPIYWDGATKSIYLGETVIPLVNAKGETVGNAKLSQGDKGVRLQIDVSGLTAGKHGIHIHEKNFDNNDFKTAGGHYNPHTKKHGHDNPEGHHMGDIPNLTAGADGKASAVIELEGFSILKDGADSIWGKSIMIHATEDDYKTDPSGNSGDRIVGGNIR
jgi:Cu-Zn family superoxide dismutase